MTELAKLKSWRPFRSINPVFWRSLVNQQTVLVLLIILEIVIFSFTAERFLTLYNMFQLPRQSIEVGMLAVALTPVIVTGGIDLSVGSLMGLSAVILGKLWRDGHWPIGAAAMATLLLGATAGLLNGILITGMRIPPLIVTLGTFSLFRGLAEGITNSADNFTSFPGSFLFLGQGELGGRLPVQIVVFAIVAPTFWILLHRMTVGRAFSAIGFSPQGARYAGIPVERRLILVYVLSGLTAGLAAIIYVAHSGQAKADAGTGYELYAITAVVLGGTSIFGGRGSVIGTLLGWLAIGILLQGLRLSLSDGATELAGILTGLLLILAIFANQTLVSFSARRRDGVMKAQNPATSINTQ